MLTLEELNTELQNQHVVEACLTKDIHTINSQIGDDGPTQEQKVKRAALLDKLIACKRLIADLYIYIAQRIDADTPFAEWGAVLERSSKTLKDTTDGIQHTAETAAAIAKACKSLDTLIAKLKALK